MDNKIEQVCPKPEQMIICPKAKECGEECFYPDHQIPHADNWGCTKPHNSNGCPACIPVPSTPASTEMIAQHGTNVAPSTPSSVPLPHDELLTDEEKINITNDVCKKNNTSWDEAWELPKLKTELIAIECYKAVAKAQLLKCHQSEAAEIAELRAEVIECNNEIETLTDFKVRSMDEYEKADAEIAELKAKITELQSHLPLQQAGYHQRELDPLDKEDRCDKCYKQGMKEVVDCVNKNKVTADYYQSDGSIAMRKGEILIGRLYWRNKLKEWGIK